jgi:hypothetical protein
MLLREDWRSKREIQLTVYIDVSYKTMAGPRLIKFQSRIISSTLNCRKSSDSHRCPKSSGDIGAISRFGFGLNVRSAKNLGIVHPIRSPNTLIYYGSIHASLGSLTCFLSLFLTLNLTSGFKRTTQRCSMDVFIPVNHLGFLID